ncbi:probable G-protein coupled receptor Mth-like 5 [Linepithema humile]|uniref:probable G-protein coupled receptor Mth-like 5 n=1 Tax=Linepithema humile TaxID=83485 RepID=UPI00351E948E
MCARSVLLLLAVDWIAESTLAVALSQHVKPTVNISKCCELEEMLVNERCIPLTEVNKTKWQPEFVKQANKASKVDYELKVGRPRCKPNEHEWTVYDYPGSYRLDCLLFLSNGMLRHYAKCTASENNSDAVFDEDDHVKEYPNVQRLHADYPFGHYCADQAMHSNNSQVGTYAVVCVRNNAVHWTDTDYLMQHAIDPAFHAVSMACYLIVAVIYFVLPQLRDLVGNIITSMMLCLVVNQCASTVRIFTEFGSHISFIIADTVIYVSLMAIFMWLSALGYYVWNAFKSRNVFLRVTDGRKYCYYSSWVWGLTICLAGTAFFAHFVLETDKHTVAGPMYPAQETVGLLGMSVMFTCIGFAVIIDLCLILTTANRIKRINTYGRIHHKMKYSFRMFVLLYVILSAGWFSLMLSQFKYKAFEYCNIVVNLLQALMVLYVCVLGQRRVTFLLSKTCNCCDVGDNTEGLDWGEEMTAINAGY